MTFVTNRFDQLPLGSFQPTASNWCHSVGIERVNVDFEWTIHDYELRGPGERLESTTFKAVHNKSKAVHNNSISWKLILKDEGISLESWPKPTHDVRVQTAFVNAKREKVFSNEIVTKDEYLIDVNETPRETRLDKRSELIVNGALTIYCEIETSVDSKRLSGHAYDIKQPLNHNKELLEDIEDLHEEMKHSDVTFTVRGNRFEAHKNILSARSKVFAAMFDHPSKEKKTRIVDVTDIEPDVFEELLHYIYTGKVPSKQMEEVAVELLAAADKYQLEKLKKACGNYLSYGMSPENCIKLLLLVDKNNPSYYLKEKAVEYIRQNRGQVVKTESWKNLAKEKPSFVVSIMEMLLETNAGTSS